MMLRRAYDLAIAADIDLPELPVIDGSPPDITISSACLNAMPPAGATRAGPYIWVLPNILFLELPGIARFRIEGGNSIQYEGAPGIDEDSIRLFLLSSALAAALLQRGLFLLHGCAVDVSGKLCIIVGRSGIGKSTLGEGLRRRGHRLLADDIVAVNQAGHALPGIPRIKLWQDVVEKLGIASAGLTRIRPNLAKYQLKSDDIASTGPMPIDRIYTLSSGHDATVVIDTLSGLEAFAALSQNSYRQRFANALGLQAVHLNIVSRIASTSRISRLQRPEGGFELEALVTAVETDAAR